MWQRTSTEYVLWTKDIVVLSTSSSVDVARRSVILDLVEVRTANERVQFDRRDVQLHRHVGHGAEAQVGRQGWQHFAERAIPSLANA
jgi:hypothetical protein